MIDGRRGELVCAVSSVKNEMGEITFHNAVDRTRRVKTILRSTLRYSHDSLGHCEPAVKELKEHKCDRVSK